MNNRMAASVILVIVVSLCCFVAAGCDPVRTTSQAVHLTVASSHTGQPMTEAQVSLKYDYERNVPPGKQQPEDQRPTYRWFSGTTDAESLAVVDVSHTALDRTLWGKPPAWRDWVTGTSYLIKVQLDGETQQLSFPIRPGESVEGEIYTIRIIEIEEPRYVPTP